MSTQSLAQTARQRVDFLVARRGTLPTRWQELPSGEMLAHSLLPLRGRRPRLQPLRGTHGTLLFTGELWKANGQSSDTDAVLQALDSVGPRRAFAKLDGNWAVVYCMNGGHIHFATDRIGEQPLHYVQWQHEGAQLAVATEIKTLIAAGHDLNSIRAVIPGIHYQFDGTGVAQHTYLGARRARSRPLGRASLPRLRHLIQESVREQAAARESKYTVAVLFSGGLDSSIIAHEAAKLGIRRAFTVALDKEAPDALHARALARQLRLDWQLLIARPASPEIAVVAGEVANRSIVEELTMHLHLAAHLQSEGIHIALTGCGADELFIGYEHLLGRLAHEELQHRLLSTYYRFDLRALNKLYGGFQVELRNPFLSRRVVDYATRIPAHVLIGARRKLKAPLRAAYARILTEAAERPKRIARETMGAKAFFRKRLGESPYCFRPVMKQRLGSIGEVLRALRRAPSKRVVPNRRLARS